MSSFENKKGLKFVITLKSKKKFSDGESNTVTIQGFRASIDIDKAGGIQLGMLKARIYGVPESDINSITSFTMQAPVNGGYLFEPNTIVITAIDGDIEHKVFAGNIINAWGEYQGAPSVFLQIEAASAAAAALAPVPARGFNEAIDVATVMSQIASSMGFDFEKNDVDKKLPAGVYLHNTDLAQARELAKIAGIGIWFDDNTLAITSSQSVPRGGDQIPLVSADSGLVGYPIFDGFGVSFDTLFNPSIRLGGRIKIESSVLRACGEWVVACVSHQLESGKPGGNWISRIRGHAHGFAIVKR